MSTSLNVDSDELSLVGSNIGGVSETVRSIYNQIVDAVEQVTSNDSWQGAASATFLEKWENIGPLLDADIKQLEELGPTLEKVANNYSEAEQQNVDDVKGGDLI